MVKRMTRIIMRGVDWGEDAKRMWPALARHSGERRLRTQLKKLGVPVASLLPAGQRALAMRKVWQHRYEAWRETREDVQVISVDANSSLMTPGYLVRSIESGLWFTTGDIVATANPELEEIPAVLLDEAPERPNLMAGEEPRRRIHGKTAPPMVSQLVVGGVCPGAGHGEEKGRSQQQIKPASAQQQREVLQERWQEYRGVLTDNIQEELELLDITDEDNMVTLPGLAKMRVERFQAEQALRELQVQEDKELHEEFLVTRTVGNQEVQSELEMWRPAIQKEWNSLVLESQAVKQITREELRKLAEERNQAVELLPAKMVYTRKAGTGLRRARAVCCGNFQTQEEVPTYAGGADAITVRLALRLGALRGWFVAPLDVKTAFLNAPRTSSSIIAAEVPGVMRQLQIAEANQIWMGLQLPHGIGSYVVMPSCQVAGNQVAVARGIRRTS